MRTRLNRWRMRPVRLRIVSTTAIDDDDRASTRLPSTARMRLFASGTDAT